MRKSIVLALAVGLALAGAVPVNASPLAAPAPCKMHEKSVEANCVALTRIKAVPVILSIREAHGR